MAFPRDTVKSLIYELVIDGEDGILANAAKIHRESIPSYLAARSADPDDGLAKPILGSLIPYSALVASSIERSLSTSMGWRLDTIFAAVAAANYDHAFGGRGRYVEIRGPLSNACVSAIDRMMDEFVNASNRRRPSQKAETQLLRASIGGRGSNDKAVRLDVFFLDGNRSRGIEWALESKTIKPNKGQLQAAKRDALTALALKLSGNANYTNSDGMAIPQGATLRPILGTYYDAWGPLVDGNFPTINTFFERGTQFRSGRETWNLVGKDESTYDEFMGLLWEIHCERGAELQRAFEGEAVAQVSLGTAADLDSKALVLRSVERTVTKTIAEWALSKVAITAETPRIVLTASSETWAGVKDKATLRTAIQGDRIQITGYYPLLFTHQSAVVEGILAALKAIRRERR